MSIYLVNKILYMTDNDPAFRDRMKETPAETVAEFKLTPEELEALLAGDVGSLYQMGVHTFLLNHLQRYDLFGVTRDNYLDRIRQGMEYDERFGQGKMPVQRFVGEGSQK
jgi:hypothetical protein